MFCLEISGILANVTFSLLFLPSTLLLVCFVAAEFLALCPNGGGITGDGRGNERKIIVCVSLILKIPCKHTLYEGVQNYLCVSDMVLQKKKKYIYHIKILFPEYMKMVIFYLFYLI